MRTIEWDLLESFQMNDLKGVRFALEKGANPNIAYESSLILLRCITDNRVEIAKALIEYEALLEAVDGLHARSALGWAAYHGRDDIIPLLLKKGAVVDAQDTYGKTALMHAVDQGHEGTVQLLLDAGASLDITDQRSRAANNFLPAGELGKRIKDQFYRAMDVHASERGDKFKKQVLQQQKNVALKRRPKI